MERSTPRKGAPQIMRTSGSLAVLIYNSIRFLEAPDTDPSPANQILENHPCSRPEKTGTLRVIADEFLVSSPPDALAVDLSLDMAGPFPIADVKWCLTVIAIWTNTELCTEIRKADFPLDRVGGTCCCFPMLDS